MKLFTRCALLLAMTVLPVVATLAATVTVTIGSVFYSPSTVTIQTGDVINFVWQSGYHPTVSDSPTPAWAPFVLSASDPSRAITFNSPGTYPYHCEVHGDPGRGQNGVITVQGTATATLVPDLAMAMSVFPNPSQGQATVRLSQKAGADCRLRLSNIIGQEVRTVALKSELTPAGLPLDLRDLRAGVYFCSLLVEGKVLTTRRLVLQN